jgi:hypothetical protein
MQNKKSFLIGSALATLLLAGATSVGAAPASTTLSGIKKDAPSQVDTVHWRRWYHCHRRWGWRRCHGYRHYGYPYGYRYYGGPGIVLGFGGWRHHHHHWGHW